MNERICIGCKWRVLSGWSGSECSAPRQRARNRVIDLVTGSRDTRWDACSWQRVGGRLIARLAGTCGVEGRWWEPRP